MRSQASIEQRREYARKYAQRNKSRKKETDHARYLKDPEKQKEYNRQWRQENRERFNARARRNRKNYSFYGTERFKLCCRLSIINNRCNNPKRAEYKNYGGRGIKNFLTLDDLEFLWKRDGAAFMKRASIHRIDNDGDYTLENCQYLELSEHLKINHKRFDKDFNKV
jgi:glycerol-3-phosphate dehydrogenase